MTLGDKIIDFAKKYILPSKVELKEEDILALPSEYDLIKPSTALSPEDRRRLALECPILMKGILKKNADTFRAWFSLYKDGSPAGKIDANIIKMFDVRTNIKKKMMTAGICADIYGDGFILLKFASGDDLSKPVEKGTILLDLIVLNPENIREMKYVDEKKTTLCYHYTNPARNEDVLIHPDRIIHIKPIELPYSMFGVSKVDILKNIIESSAEIDIAVGEILKWFSHGIQVLTKQGMTKSERERALKLLSEHPNYFAFNEKYKLEVTKPEAINPEPFFDYIITCISSVLVMPKHVLTGVQIGRVTGAEVSYGDYYRDIKDMQDLIYTPALRKIYEYLFASYDKEFNYDIVWDVVYVDETSEAQLLKNRMDSAVAGVTAGIITKEEARRIISEGAVKLDEDMGDAEIKAEAIYKSLRESKNTIRKLTDDEKEMIKNAKKMLDEVIKKERKLGEEILKEQDDLFKDDKNVSS